MTRYIIKRLLWTIPVIIGVILIVFCLRAITPGDPVDNLLPEDATLEQREALREELGLNDPLPVQFVKYVADVFTLDLGTSYKTKLPVLDEILDRLPTTAIICFGAVALGFFLGVPMGVYSAYRQYSAFDSAMLVISMFARSIPGFCLALLMISLFSVKLGWFPAYGMSVVKHISDEIAVMYLGQVVEKCGSGELFQNTLHPYSQALLSAIPIPSIHVERKKILLQGELTSPINPKKCCRFAPRCPYACDQCFNEEPEYREVRPGHFVKCHKVESSL